MLQRPVSKINIKFQIWEKDLNKQKNVYQCQEDLSLILNSLVLLLLKFSDKFENRREKDASQSSVVSDN